MIGLLVWLFVVSWVAIGDLVVASKPYATPQLVPTNKAACLIAHNAKRALHCVPDLQWDDSLVPGAEAWALYHARKPQVGMEHSQGNGGKFRENIYYKFMKPVGTLGTCADAVQWWYDEIRFYNYKKPGYSLPSSHFTQLIWKTSIKVGVAMAASTRGRYTYTFVVAHYSPAGNVRGTFASNVPDLKCKSAPIPYLRPQIYSFSTTDCLNDHNAKRALHGVPGLRWDSSLASGAAAWALILAKDASPRIRASSGNGRNYRENIYYRYAAPPGTVTSCAFVVQAWYDEIKNYNFRRPGFKPKAAHFTQLIWKSSTRVGVGIAVVTRKNLVTKKTYTYTFIVARYAPAGNIYGRFSINVPNLLSTGPCRDCGTDAVPYSTPQITTFASKPYATPQLVPTNKTACLIAHNAKRALHCVPDLQWDDSLVPGAEAWALYHARKPQVGMEHSQGNGGKFRENIYYKFMKPVGTLGTCADAVQWWYDEIRFYNYKKPGYSLPSSHFTQLIWKTSIKVGVAMAASTRGRYTYTFVVAHYSPAGNVRGTFASNVPDLKCKSAPIPYLKPQIYSFSTTECLNAHNAKRALHGVPGLRWDSSLASGAAAWALTLAKDASPRIRASSGNGGNYRENIYYRYAAPPGTVTSCAFVVQAWYDEIKNYNFRRPDFKPKAAHFTQLIWKSSTRVGVGIAVVTRKNLVTKKTYTYTFIVARYAPAGNIYGRFSINVPNLLSTGPCRDCGTDAVPYSTPQITTFNVNNCLNALNAKRALHGVPNLRWRTWLASGAARWALKLAKKSRVQMRPSRGNGRRYREIAFYKFTSPPGTVASCADAVQWWYSQIKHYNFNWPRFRSRAQHFTQLIWKRSTKVGVGIAAASRRGYTYTFIVARFAPPGNIYHRFATNVPRPV